MAVILVMDDEPPHVDILASLLGGEGYAVITASDGEDGLQRARASRPDLVITDMRMPRLDGLMLVDALRADPATRQIPVLLLAATRPDNMDDLQIAAFIAKPFGIEDILRAVAAHLPR